MGSVISLPWNKSLLLELLENLPVEIFLEVKYKHYNDIYNTSKSDEACNYRF